MDDNRFAARLALPPGTPIILPAPASGLACVGVDAGARQVLFAGPRPDGQWPSPAGWLPGGPGTPGIDDSGWRLTMTGLVDLRVEPGKVYPRGTYVGQVATTEGLQLALAWLEDFTPDRVIYVDPAVLINGLATAYPPVRISAEAQKVPAVVTSADGTSQVSGSVTLVNRDGRTALATGNGTVVNVGDLNLDLTLWGVDTGSAGGRAP